MRLPSPKTWIWVHGVLTVLWVILIVPSLLWWRESVPWLVLMSAWANVAGSAASLQAARADQNSPTREDLARLENKIAVLLRHVAELRR